MSACALVYARTLRGVKDFVLAQGKYERWKIASNEERERYVHNKEREKRKTQKCKKKRERQSRYETKHVVG